MPRETGFDITVASEIMAIFCLAGDLKDLERGLGNIVVGYAYDQRCTERLSCTCAILADAAPGSA